MSWAKGKPELKIVIKRPQNQADYIVLIADGLPLEGTFQNNIFSIGPVYSDFGEEYEPDFLTHELQDGTIKRKLRGFRYKARISFEGLSGELLHHLRFMMDRNAHTSIEFYPSYVSHPNYKEVVTIDDDSIRFYYFSIRLPWQKDFDLKLIGNTLRADVPELTSSFDSWANDHLLIEEINETFDALP
jgi:hypothetical protein